MSAAPNPPTRWPTRWEVVLRLHTRHALRTQLVTDNSSSSWGQSGIPARQEPLLPGKHGVDGDGVVHRRHAKLIPGQAEVQPVDLDLAVHFHLCPVEAGDPRGEGHRTGAVPDGKGPRHGGTLSGRRDLLRGEGDVRVLGGIEEARRAQVL